MPFWLVKDAHSNRASNPQYLVKKSIRMKIYASSYWKDTCHSLLPEEILSRTFWDLRYVGGLCFASDHCEATPFLCLTLKLLQIQPDKDFIVKFIRNRQSKYTSMLGAMYMRLTGTAMECYKYLDPLYFDNGTLKVCSHSRDISKMFVADFLDKLLLGEELCDISLPWIHKRHYVLANPPLNVDLEEDVDERKYPQKRLTVLLYEDSDAEAFFQIHDYLPHTSKEVLDAVENELETEYMPWLCQ